MKKTPFLSVAQKGPSRRVKRQMTERCGRDCSRLVHSISESNGAEPLAPIPFVQNGYNQHNSSSDRNFACFRGEAFREGRPFYLQSRRDPILNGSTSAIILLGMKLLVTVIRGTISAGLCGSACAGGKI
jgi:hypothetical protein